MDCFVALLLAMTGLGDHATRRATMNRNQFLTAALQNPANEIIAEELFRLALPDAWLVSGCLVQTAWNVLTSRAVDYGIKDYDVFYFDPDTSWKAEDKIIGSLTEGFAGR